MEQTARFSKVENVSEINRGHRCSEGLFSSGRWDVVKIQCLFVRVRAKVVFQVGEEHPVTVTYWLTDGMIKFSLLGVIKSAGEWKT